MVRIYTFVGLCAGTYVGVKALDNLVVWMADRREANADNFKLDREAAHLRHQLLQEIKEKEATAPSTVHETHETHPDEHLTHRVEQKSLSKHQEDKHHKLPDKHQNLPAKALKEKDDPESSKKCQEDMHKKLPDKSLKKQDDRKGVGSQPENCPGEVVAECLDCGETFEIVEPVPHSPKKEG